MFKQIYQNKYKKVIVDTKSGLKKEVILDQNTREEIAKGVHLQPYGKDDKRFFDTFKQNKKLPFQMPRYNLSLPIHAYP